ncbi:MAG: hypothetical protein GY870_04010 [archaeon]|nr:hypothetical protein [archaeon]
MADKIKKEVGVASQLIPGSNGIYDIIVDGNTIYSKDRTKQFPDNDEIVKLLKQ